jgi:hypothetical protein
MAKKPKKPENNASEEEKGDVNIKKKLVKFLKNNPKSQLRRLKDPEKIHYIHRPWNDESIILVLWDESDTKLITVLNALILPEKFSAIYHMEDNKMEFIYSPLDKDDPDITRKFNIKIEGKQYTCQYQLASDKLLTLSQYCGRAKFSATEFRNLLQFRDYMKYKTKKKSKEKEGSLKSEFEGKVPISFYVTGFDSFDEDDLIKVSRHINFYLQYYDRVSPVIVIHQTESKDEDLGQLRLIKEEFPTEINTQVLDSFLLTLMDSALEAEPRLEFIYYYQVLEYSSFYYVKDNIKRKLIKIINSPDVLCNSNECISRIMEAIDEIRQEDDAKIKNTIKSACELEELWREINENKAYFSKNHKFDGGFEIEPIITEDTNFEQFLTCWHPTISNNLKYIRNALVHGREKQFGKVILPTHLNDTLLMPWIQIAHRIAEHVIIYGSLG